MMNNNFQQDALLSAYIDGELDNTDKVRLEQQLAQSPSLQLRLAELRQADQSLAESFEALDAEPMPDTIKQLLQGDELLLNKLHKAQSFSADETSPHQQETTAKRQPLLPNWWHSAAAGLVAFVLGATLSTSFNGSTKPSASLSLATNHNLQNLLTHTPSGKSVSSAQGTMLAELSFIDKNQRLCRQFYIQQAASEPMRGIACQQQQQWQTHILVPATAINSQDQHYQTASANMQAIDHYLELNMSGMPMDAEQESEHLN